MTDTTLTAALNRRNEGRPPVWMMRQAGRYHSHYQMLKRYNDFITLCREPELAAEVALGPIHDFNFDAAILFSDLLFPLEAMGMGLRYDPGPKLDFHLRSMADVARLTGGAQRASHMQFQADAVTLRVTVSPPEVKPVLGVTWVMAGGAESVGRQGDYPNLYP